MKKRKITQAELHKEEWRKENTTRFAIRLNNDKDKDIIELINNSNSSKSAIIKEALKSYVASPSREEIIDWISEHETLFEDFKTHFNIK